MIRNSRIWLGLVLVVGVFAQDSYGKLFEAEDALIVEVDDDQYSDEESTTFESTTDNVDSCQTIGGLPGQCIKSRDCFPYLYLESKDGSEFESIYTYGLNELVQNTTESCGQESTTVSSVEPIKPGDKLVCCVTLSRATGRQIPGWPIQHQPIQNPQAADGSPAKQPTCGVTQYVLFDKVVGGREARPGEYPFIVALLNNGANGQRHFCGGTLIDSKTVITAAHCVNSMRSASLLKRVSLLIGDHNLYTASEVRHEARKVKRLVFHKKFNDRVLQYDIALLHLDQPVTFTDKIQPACLHSGSPAYDGGQMNADVSGWGKVYDNGPQSKNLMTARIRVWTNSECSQKYYGTQAPTISPSMVCAGTASPMRDSCQGDSGGPLTVNVEGREYLAGIVSWGIKCGEYPGVYTRVDKYLTWINKYRAQ